MVAASEREGDRGIDSVALELDAVAIAAGVLVHRGRPHRGPVTHPVAEVQHQAPVVERAGLHRGLPHARPVCLASRAVDDAAGAAAAEDHRVRSLERLDPVHVVQVPEVLHIVSETVDVEVAR